MWTLPTGMRRILIVMSHDESCDICSRFTNEIWPPRSFGYWEIQLSHQHTIRHCVVFRHSESIETIPHYVTIIYTRQTSQTAETRCCLMRGSLHKASRTWQLHQQVMNITSTVGPWLYQLEHGTRFSFGDTVKVMLPRLQANTKSHHATLSTSMLKHVLGRVG